VGLPLFSADGDPGPSFWHFAEGAGLTGERSGSSSEDPHATTVIAVRYNAGVVMVADRQATGNYIASRDVRKIEAADRFTALAISGSAARGMELLKLAQLSFEHYEKMTDSLLSLEGKANYLGPFIQRNNLSSPFIVLPMLAGYDTGLGKGRVFEYDGAGGCYERDDFAVIGSGTPFAEGALRMGFREDLTIGEAIELAALAVYEAGDNDPSTGGPDFIRGIFPMVVTVTVDGYHELDEPAAADLFRAISDRRAQSRGRAGSQLR
jgi:proteasome beta subunit